MDLRNYMKSKGFDWTESHRASGLVGVMNCPFCKDNEKKFAISLQDGAFNCLHQNNCGVKGSWWDFQKMLGDTPVKLDNDKSLFISRKPVYEKPKVHADVLKDDGILFLSGRGFKKETVKKFKLGQRNGSIMFPYFKDGELTNVKYRDIKEKKFHQEKNAEPTLFNRDNCTGAGLLICEGEFDAMAWHEYNIPAVSVPSGVADLRWIENEWEYLNKFQKIYLSLDNDKAGQDAVDEIVNRLGRWRCYNITLPLKDCNDCLINNIPVEKITECFSTAKEYDPDTLKKAKDFEFEINDLFQNPQKLYGIMTPFEGLNNILRGWREEELTIWSGRNASGKTSIINEVIIDLVRKKHRVVMASLEMPAKRYLRWMLMNMADKNYLDQAEVKENLEKIGDYLFILNVVGEIKPDMILDVFDYAARKYGVKHFFIDSLMKISIGGVDVLEKQKIFCNELINKLAVTHKGHVHLVAHPRKSFKDSDKPDKVDVAGTGDLTNLAHNVLMIWRPDEDLKTKMREKGKDVSDSVLFVKKNREWGMEGHIDFNFNPETKKFKEAIK